jgi:hypothetical protein
MEDTALAAIRQKVLKLREDEEMLIPIEVPVPSVPQFSDEDAIVLKGKLEALLANGASLHEESDEEGDEDGKEQEDDEAGEDNDVEAEGNEDKGEDEEEEEEEEETQKEDEDEEEDEVDDDE